MRQTSLTHLYLFIYCLFLFFWRTRADCILVMSKYVICQSEKIQVSKFENNRIDNVTHVVLLPPFQEIPVFKDIYRIMYSGNIKMIAYLSEIEDEAVCFFLDQNIIKNKTRILSVCDFDPILPNSGGLTLQPQDCPPKNDFYYAFFSFLLLPLIMYILKKRRYKGIYFIMHMISYPPPPVIYLGLANYFLSNFKLCFFEVYARLGLEQNGASLLFYSLLFFSLDFFLHFI